VKTFKFRETLELIKMGNPEPTPFKKKKAKNKGSESKNKRKGKVQRLKGSCSNK